MLHIVYEVAEKSFNYILTVAKAQGTYSNAMFFEKQRVILFVVVFLVLHELCDHTILYILMDLYSSRNLFSAMKKKRNHLASFIKIGQ